MPMYYADLNSVKRTCVQMSEQPDPSKKYTGVIPEKEEELPEARKQLGQYFREVWNDEIAAIEVELAATRENYDQVLHAGVVPRMRSLGGRF